MAGGRKHEPINAGVQFGRLTVEEFAGIRKGGFAQYRCRCACGEACVVLAALLRNGGTKSCGCYSLEAHRAAVSKAKTTHGLTHHPLYKVWASMMDRCYKETNPGYRLYGARGIKVCKRWHDVKRFVADMEKMPRPETPAGRKRRGFSLDRIDNDGDYKPGNCRWATQKQQMANVSYNVKLTHAGETLVISEWARRVGISLSGLLMRFKLGWSIKRALTTPRRKGNFRTKCSPIFQA